VEDFGERFQRLRLASPDHSPLRHVPVLRDPRPPPLPDEIAGGRELGNSLKDGVRGLDVPEREVVVERFEVDRALEPRVLQQGLQLGREGDPFSIMGVVEWFLTDTIAREEEPARGLVPESEREHAAKLADAVNAVLLIGMDDHLGVGACRKYVALRLKPRA